MELKYLWNTNIVIYYLQRLLPIEAEERMDLIATSPIVFPSEIELYCWKTPAPNDLGLIYEFVGDAVVLDLKQEIRFKTAELRQNFRIKLPDAIIAATALVHDLTLLTNNVKDFMVIKGLRMENPAAAD
nr:type II toxin-antitoxin system VapC family toxin [uncultured Dyadobacter sp.]